MKLKKEYIFLATIFLVGFLLRIYKLGFESIWLDESVSIKQSLFPSLILKDIHMPLYALLLKVWTSLFGISEIAVRMPSVIFGTFSILAIYFLGKKLFNKTVGLISAIFLCFSFYFIYYSQEARLYTLFVLLTILSFYFFSLYLEKKDTKNAIIYLFFNLLGVYTQLFFWMIILIQNIFYFAKNLKNKKSFFNWGILQGILILAFFPGLYLFKGQIPLIPESLSWLASLNIIHHIKRTCMLFFNTEIIFFIFIGLAVLTVLFVFINVLKIDKKEVSSIVMLLLWAIIPFVILISISLLFLPLYTDKYLMFTLPAFYLIFSWLISKMFKKGGSKLIVVLIILIISISPLIDSFTVRDKENWRELALFLKNNVEEKDFIILYPAYLLTSFDYYYDKNDCFMKNETETYSCSSNKNIFIINSSISYNNSTVYKDGELKDSMGYRIDYTNHTLWIINRGSRSISDDSFFNYLSNQKNLSLIKEFSPDPTSFANTGRLVVYKFE